MLERAKMDAADESLSPEFREYAKSVIESLSKMERTYSDVHQPTTVTTFKLDQSKKDYASLPLGTNIVFKNAEVTASFKKGSKEDFLFYDSHPDGIVPESWDIEDPDVPRPYKQKCTYQACGPEGCNTYAKNGCSWTYARDKHEDPFQELAWYYAKQPPNSPAVYFGQGQNVVLSRESGRFDSQKWTASFKLNGGIAKDIIQWELNGQYERIIATGEKSKVELGFQGPNTRPRNIFLGFVPSARILWAAPTVWRTTGVDSCEKEDNEWSWFTDNALLDNGDASGAYALCEGLQMDKSQGYSRCIAAKG
ncbi:hypothetical protein EDD86DRAFT_51911 [Gorgonomyces haynaldii]|nr:hypothetical protein EDD86DRAFT_51911 [Gorgonomyces haynaldii]